MDIKDTREKIELNRTGISTEDNFQLNLLYLIPVCTPKAVIQFNSGTVTNKEFYLKLATFLCESGYIVVLYDYRGVGESRPKSLKGFQASISDWGAKDAYTVLEWIKVTFPKNEIHLLAHSMGGQLLGLMSNWKDLSKIILLATSSGNFNKFAPKYRWKIKYPSILLFPIFLKHLGYIPKIMGTGSDWPSGVAKDWLSNSRNNGIMSDYQKNKTGKTFYEEIDKEIEAWYFQDDHMSTPSTIEDIHLTYPNAIISTTLFKPNDLELKRIGHFGIFKSFSKTNLWTLLVSLINNEKE